MPVGREMMCLQLWSGLGLVASPRVQGGVHPQYTGHTVEI